MWQHNQAACCTTWPGCTGATRKIYWAYLIFTAAGGRGGAGSPQTFKRVYGQVENVPLVGRARCCQL